jgi:hypothetical protein
VTLKWSHQLNRMCNIDKLAPNQIWWDLSSTWLGLGGAVTATYGGIWALPGWDWEALWRPNMMGFELYLVGIRRRCDGLALLNCLGLQPLSHLAHGYILLPHINRAYSALGKNRYPGTVGKKVQTPDWTEKWTGTVRSSNLVMFSTHCIFFLLNYFDTVPVWFFLTEKLLKIGD